MKVIVCHDPKNEFKPVALDILPENRDEERLLGIFSGLVSAVVNHEPYDKLDRLQLNLRNPVRFEPARTRIAEKD